MNLCISFFIRVLLNRYSFILLSFILCVYTACNKNTGISKFHSYLLYPIMYTQHCVANFFDGYFEQRRNSEEMTHKIQQLKKKNDELITEIIALKASRHFILETKELIKFRERYTSEPIAFAQVVGRHLSERQQFLLIDCGSSKGIFPGMVAVCNNALVGKVIEAFPLYSKVQLITDQNCNVAAYCSRTHARGIHEGINHAHKTALRFVNHLSSLKKDDFVLTSGEGTIFPQGFGLGKIKSFKKGELHYSATIEPFINVHSIKYCYILQKGENA